MLSQYPIAIFVDSDGKYNHCTPQHAMALPAGTQVVYVTCSASVHALLMDSWNTTARTSRLEMLAKNTGRTDVIPINPCNTETQNRFEETNSEVLAQECGQDGHVFVWFASNGNFMYSPNFSQIPPGEVVGVLRVKASVLARLWSAFISNDGQYERYTKMLASGLGVSQNMMPPIPSEAIVDETNWYTFVSGVQPIQDRGKYVPRVDPFGPIKRVETSSGDMLSVSRGSKTDTSRQSPSSKPVLQVVDENFIANNG